MAITTALIGDKATAAASFKAIFPGHSPEDVARAAGALDGSHVEFSGHGDSYLLAEVHHPQLHTFRFFTKHNLSGGRSFVSVEHGSQWAHTSIRGNGYQRFGEAIKHLKKVGVSGITVSAAIGSKEGKENGYYTWPRMGFNGELSPEQFASLSPELQGKMKAAGKNDLHTLFDVGGGEEWRERGTSLNNMHFDLRDGSEHLRRFEAYHNERVARQTAGGDGQAAGTGSHLPTGAAADSGHSNPPTNSNPPGAGLDQRFTRALSNLRRQYERERSSDPVRYSMVGDFGSWLKRKILGTSKPQPSAAAPTPSRGSPPTGSYRPIAEAGPGRSGKSPQRNRDWQPKYPEFAVSPDQGLYDSPDRSQDESFESAPATSHLLGWRLQGGGFVRKFYGPAVDAPKGTSQVINVRFRDKKRGHSEYEYYFRSEDEADEWLSRLRAADHPGKVIWAMIRAEIPYKRKYQRQGETVVRYSRSFVALVLGDYPTRFEATEERPAHPLIRGFRIEHALRHLTTDPTANQSSRQLASMVLHDGSTDALAILNDSLQEDGHPLWEQYNWLNATHKIHTDDAVGEAIKAVAKHEATVGDEGPLEGQMRAVQTLRMTHDSRHRPIDEIGQDPWEEYPPVAAAHEALHELDQHIDPKDIEESLHRHHLRIADTYWADHDEPLHRLVTDRAKEEALDPKSTRQRAPISPELLEASRYSRFRKLLTDRVRYRRDSVHSVVGAAFNDEINKVADRLHQQHGVADIDQFKQHDHYGRLLAATNYNPEVAHDTAADLVFGGLERQHTPGQPLLPVVKSVGRFAVRKTVSTARRQLPASLFTDVIKPDTTTKIDVAETPAIADVHPNTIIANRDSAFDARDRDRKAKATYNQKLKTAAPSEIGPRLLNLLLKKRGGLTSTKVTQRLLAPIATIRKAADEVGVKVERRYDLSKHPADVFYHPTDTIPVDTRKEELRSVLQQVAGGKSQVDIAKERGVQKAAVWKILQTAKKLFPEEAQALNKKKPLPQKFRRAVEEVVRYSHRTGGFRWEDLNRWLGRRDERNIDRNKAVYRDAGDIVTRLHNTEVVRAHPDGTFTLAHGGWNTPTTKRTISNFSPVRPFSDGGRLYIGGWPSKETYEFFNGIRVDENGKPLHLYPNAEHIPNFKDRLEESWHRGNYRGDHTQAAVDYLRGRGPHPGAYPLSETQKHLALAGHQTGDDTAWLAFADSLHEHGHELFGSIVHAATRGDNGAVSLNDFYHSMPEDSFEYRVLRRYSNPHHTTGEVRVRLQDDDEGNARGRSFQMPYPNHETPHQYARRQAATDFVSALRRVRSQQQDTLRKLADAIHTKLDLKPTTIRDAIYDHVHVAATANTAQALYHGDPERARVAAAWYGLQTQTPSLLVFHVDETGPESVHKITVSGSGERLRAALTKAGIHQRTLLPTGNGWDCLVYDKLSALGDRVQQVAGSLGGKLSVSRGSGEIIGGSDGNDDARADAKSRATYRKIISSWERQQAAARPQPPQPQQVQFTGTIQPQPAGVQQ